jgi:hypothetical protein
LKFGLAFRWFTSATWRDPNNPVSSSEIYLHPGPLHQTTLLLVYNHTLCKYTATCFTFLPMLQS